MASKRQYAGGFTLVETAISIMLLGIILAAFMGIFVLFQKSSTQNHNYIEAQQNARIAIDYITEDLRQAGSATDYVRGQRFIVHAAPYQVAVNADIDNGQNVGGHSPLQAISRAHSPSTVPPSGTTIYSPQRDYDSPAETVVLTLDSSNDGVITGGDQGDDVEEGGQNPRLYMVKKLTYGFNGASANEMRSANLAMIRGPGPDANGSYPQPLFQYSYDHDDDVATPDKVWGDNSPEDGKLTDNEIAVLNTMPDNLLSSIRKIKINVVSESDQYSEKFKNNGGFLAVSMQSEVHVRNSTRSSSVVYGKVFHDVNGDGIEDPNENGLPNVKVRLVGVNRTLFTNSAGFFYFPVGSGDYSVQEFDPPGYVSTTPNLVSASVASGQATIVNFGDQSGGPIGVIRGTVYDDLNQSGTFDVGEVGVSDVTISLDTGEEQATDENGKYSFTVPVNSYNVVETDPEGFGSTTPNAVTADILAAGDTVTVDFGDNANPIYGIIEGYVFEDDDNDGIRDGGEGGLANVTLTLSSGDSTTTSAGGFYQFSVPPSVYWINERDMPGYTSSTVNTVVGIVIVPDTTVTVNFGDFLLNQDDFVEIDIGNTSRALSVEATDLNEDSKSDMDIVVGTPFSAGPGNMLVFHNKWKNHNTALTQLFDSTPTYQRDTGANINALTIHDFSDDGDPDVAAGIEENSSSNIQLWFDGNGGALSSSPDAAYISSASTFVIDAKLANLNSDAHMDIVVGLRAPFSTFTGGFQTFRGGGGGSFSSWSYVTTAGPSGNINLGEIWALDTGDIDGDGDADIVVGSYTNNYAGFIDIYENIGNASGNLTWHSRYFVPGGINTLKVVDMMEDSAGDPDILAGISHAPNSGMLLLWLNNSGSFGRADTTGYTFGPDETPNWPDDTLDPGGEAMSIDVDVVNPDVFPDVFIGTRSSSFFSGDIIFVETFGLLPTSGRTLNSVSIGEVISMKIADFDKDNLFDVVVGTRTSSAQGKLLIYFYND